MIFFLTFVYLTSSIAYLWIGLKDDFIPFVQISCVLSGAFGFCLYVGIKELMTIYKVNEQVSQNRKSYIRIGTFWCWLFGHKFCMWRKETIYADEFKTLVFSENCVRCGIDKPKSKALDDKII